MSRRAGLFGSAYSSRDYHSGDYRRQSSHRTSAGASSRRTYDDYEYYDRGYGSRSAPVATSSSTRHYTSYARHPEVVKTTKTTTRTAAPVPVRTYADPRDTKRDKHVHWPDETFGHRRGGSGSNGRDRDASYHNHQPRRQDYADNGHRSRTRAMTTTKTTYITEASPRVAAETTSRRRHQQPARVSSGDAYAHAYAEEMQRRARKTTSRTWY